MEGEYKELMNAFDEKMLPHLQKFNQYDLYSKENSKIEIDETFYKKLIDRYFQEKIIFLKKKKIYNKTKKCLIILKPT